MAPLIPRVRLDRNGLSAVDTMPHAFTVSPADALALRYDAEAVGVDKLQPAGPVDCRGDGHGEEGEPG
jgi:hypothetical protein